jgi:hypothetical protein
VHERAVGHHRALRPRGRAGRVEQLDERVVGRVGVDLGDVAGGGAGQQRVLRVAQRERRAVAEHGVEVLLQLRVEQHGAAAGLLEQVGELVAGERVVDRHVDEPGARAGEEAEQVRVRVAPVGGDAVAGREARAQQRAGGAGDGGVELGVGPLPVLEAQRHAVGPAPGAAGHDAVDGAGPGAHQRCSSGPGSTKKSGSSSPPPSPLAW